MISVENLTKRFSDFTAIDNISCQINDGSIYGLVGANGAGKSTFLRIISGVYKPDSGKVLMDGAEIWENPASKARIAYVSDDPYFTSHSTLTDMEKMYRSVFARFDTAKFNGLINDLSLDKKKPINSFSKGMKRQAAISLAMSLMPDYILLDETFDGLDPVMRSIVKSLISADVIDRGTTAVITSHSLRELEDTCDQLAMLHKGGVVLQSDVSDLKTEQFKIQIAFEGDYDRSKFDGIEFQHFVKQGSVSCFIARGDRDIVAEKLKELHPKILDILPLSLEEIFTYELEALGYTAALDEKNDAKGGKTDEK